MFSNWRTERDVEEKKRKLYSFYILSRLCLEVLRRIHIQEISPSSEPIRGPTGYKLQPRIVYLGQLFLYVDN
jgi:hypothetical protein